MEDKELIMGMLRDERAWTEHSLNDPDEYWSGQAGEERIYLARLNAEIARRIPQWEHHTWTGKEMVLMVEL